MTFSETHGLADLPVYRHDEPVPIPWTPRSAARWRLALGEATRAALRKRSLCIQYGESDLAFVARLLAQEGLHYWFEHLSDEDGAQAPQVPN